MIDLEAAVVVDETELLELVHEEVHARARRADHFRQRLLRDPRQHAMGLVRLAVARQQEQRARQPLLAGIEQLIDKVFFDAEVPSQHVADEPVRQGVLIVEQANHLPFRDDQHRRRGHRGRGLQANGMTRQCPLTEEVARPQHRHDRLFSAPRQHRKLDGALLNVHDGVGRITLRENDVGGLIGRDCFPRPGGTEKRFRVEPRLLLAFHGCRNRFCIIASTVEGARNLRTGDMGCGPDGTDQQGSHSKGFVREARRSRRPMRPRPRRALAGRPANDG